MNYYKNSEITQIKKRNQIVLRRLAMWDITYFCNLSCKHCYNAENVKRDKISKAPLSLEQCKCIVDNLAQKGFNEVNLAGGEPLSNPYIDKLIEYILSVGLIPSVNTNGLLLTRDLANKLVELKFSNISISLAGITEQSNSLVRGKGTISKVNNNLKYFLDQLSHHGVANNTSINFSVLKANIDELPELYEFCYNLGVSSTNVHLTQAMGAAVDNPEIIEYDYKLILEGFESLISRWGKAVRLILDTRLIAADYLCRKYRLPKSKILSDCPAGDRNIYIQPDGQMQACKLQSISDQYVRGGQQIDLSNLKKISLTENIWKKSVSVPPTCTRCKFSQTCTVCPLLTYEEKISECEIAVKVSDEYDEGILNRPIWKSMSAYEVKADEGQTIIINNGKKFKFSDSGYVIWQKIANNDTLYNVIKLTHEKIPNLPRQEVIEFFHELRKTGLVSFINDCAPHLPIRCDLICCAR